MPHTLRSTLPWLTFPVTMGGFVAATALGLSAGVDTTLLVPALTVANFFWILLLEQLLPRNPAMNALRDRQSLNDIGHGLLAPVLARSGVAAATLLGVAALAEMRDGVAGGLWPQAWAFPLQLGLGLLIWTFADYWVHRALHTFGPLWWFHAVHHDTPQMHILKSGRLHFGEEALNQLLKPIPLLLLGAPPGVIVWVGLWTIFDGNLVHSNVDQRFPGWAHYFVPTVHLHNLHHAMDRRNQDANYSGSSAIWDVLFGTFRHPDRCPLGPLGIEDSPVPPGFLAQLAFPFRAQVRPPEPVGGPEGAVGALSSGASPTEPAAARPLQGA